MSTTRQARLTGAQLRLGLSSGLALTIAACAQAPAPPPPVAAPPVLAPPPPAPPPAPKFFATPGLSPRERMRKVLTLLGDGQRDQARAELEQFLREQPDNDLGKSLLEQIDKDPKVLLGEQHFPYKLKPGETISMVAERFLGDRMLFYALARYNGIDAPARAEVGQVLQIPGTPKPVVATHHPKRARSEEEEVDARVKEPSAKKSAPVAAAPSPPPPPPPPPAPKPVRNPARANALRGQALVQMNNGAINRAVALLREALQLDPGNARIQQELDRALRIQAATRGR